MASFTLHCGKLLTIFVKLIMSYAYTELNTPYQVTVCA